VIVELLNRVADALTPAPETVTPDAVDAIVAKLAALDSEDGNWRDELTTQLANKERAQADGGVVRMARTGDAAAIAQLADSTARRRAAEDAIEQARAALVDIAQERALLVEQRGIAEQNRKQADVEAKQDALTKAAVAADAAMAVAVEAVTAFCDARIALDRAAVAAGQTSRQKLADQLVYALSAAWMPLLLPITGTSLEMRYGFSRYLGGLSFQECASLGYGATPVLDASKEQEVSQ